MTNTHAPCLDYAITFMIFAPEERVRMRPDSFILFAQKSIRIKLVRVDSVLAFVTNTRPRYRVVVPNRNLGEYVVRLDRYEDVIGRDVGGDCRICGMAEVVEDAFAGRKP